MVVVVVVVVNMYVLWGDSIGQARAQISLGTNEVSLLLLLRVAVGLYTHTLIVCLQSFFDRYTPWSVCVCVLVKQRPLATRSRE